MAINPFLSASSSKKSTHTKPVLAPHERRSSISLYVSNKPGVLVRVAQVFARRGFNIDSLVVSPGKDPEFSRMTIECHGASDSFDQIIKQCAKLVDVVHAGEHDGDHIIAREFALIKVGTTQETRSDILQIIEHFKAWTVDFTDESLIIQIAGSTEKLDSAVGLLEPYGIIEQVRTGRVIMARGKEET
ncbi:MAG: acetolactate synthase small subunit [Candidatus Lindowbacteria bacterium]|nr:acetolactate synthase small subunit [Candidatus Lindowbacteria bacterium]